MKVKKRPSLHEHTDLAQKVRIMEREAQEFFLECSHAFTQDSASTKHAHKAYIALNALKYCLEEEYFALGGESPSPYVKPEEA